ncbi:MAG: glycosyltransferase family 39 protein [Anaerolineae bacterium]|nr:glycosyltransferase family 39 protein [Anaerolineae bacterium]
MIDALIPWLAAAIALLWAYPWARWLARRDPLLTLLLTVTLSPGGLAWIMQGLAAISPALVAFWPVTGLLALGSGAGWWVLRSMDNSHRPRGNPNRPRGNPNRPRGNPHQAPDTPRDPDARHPLRLATILVVLLLVALTLFNAAYWPLGEDDALSLYAPMAYRFATTGQFGIIGGGNDAGLYNAYPQLIPLAMAYLQLAAGAPHEYAGRFVVAVLGLAMAGAACALGRELFGRRAGLAAAYLVAATPILLHWASAAYTDLPAGTYYTLALLFAWRMARRSGDREALLAGLLGGLAAFTKNSALLIAPTLAGWVIYTWWARWRDPAREAVRPRQAGLLAGGFLLAAGPWYGHALLAYGYLVPPTGWTSHAQHTLAALLGPALVFSQYMLNGALVVLGMGWQIVRLWRTRWAFEARAALLVGFSVPYWGVWWWLFSYELRFLLLIWGVLAVMGGGALLAGWEALSCRWQPSRRWQAPVRWLASRHLLRVLLPLLVVALALPAMRTAVDHKPALLRDPLMSDQARHLQQLGDRWLAVVWLQNNAPPGSRVLVADYKLTFGLLRAGLRPDFNDNSPEALVRGYDYWLASRWQQPDWIAASDLREVFAVDGYRVYAVP